MSPSANQGVCAVSKHHGRDSRNRGPRKGPRQRGGGRAGGPRRPRFARKEMDQLEGRNVVLEALKREQRQVFRIALDAAARPNDKLSEILTLASHHGV